MRNPWLLTCSWLGLLFSGAYVNMPFVGLLAALGFPVWLGLLITWMLRQPPGEGYQRSVLAGRGGAALCVAASLGVVVACAAAGLDVSNYLLLAVQRKWEGYQGFPVGEVLGFWLLAVGLFTGALRLRTGPALKDHWPELAAIALLPPAVAGLVYFSGMPLDA